MSAARYKIGMLTPYSWTVPTSVNRHVQALAERFSAGGHQVTVIAPSDDKTALRAARQRVRAVLLGEAPAVFAQDEPSPRYFFAGGTYPVRHNRSLRVIAAPVDLISNIDVLMESEDLDLLHLHEPFAPSLGWTALRHAKCPLVATFHANSERLTQYWLTRPIFERFFASFDAVIATSQAARDTAARTFPGDYRIVRGGVDLECFRPADGRRPGPPRLLFVGAESRRKGLGVLLRALRYMEDDLPPFTLDVCGADTQEQRFAWVVPPAFARRVRFRGRLSSDALAELYRDADVVCAPSAGGESTGAVLLEAMASGAAVVATRVPGYDELIEDGANGVLVTVRRARTLAQALRPLLVEPGLREGYAREGLRRVQTYDWDHVARQVGEVYEQVVGKVKRRPVSRPPRQKELFADLHVHSHHSADCAVPVADLLARAAELGIDVLAICDHNSVAGGLEGCALAGRYGVRVIVGEEVKTAQGELIGLFLEETIPEGKSFAETIAAIRAQGGVVYVPHPFDRLHFVPSRTVLRENVAGLDVVEVFNSRLAFPAFNETAERFARRYRIAAAAGSDSHVLPGLGTAMTAMDEFEGASDFVAALAESRIVRRPKSILYLGSLKFLQTKVDAIGRR
jgi:glycosyltransferase involved in cell wall biosynthesis/predicted metal-dependent phosphoesterase TrpH